MQKQIRLDHVRSILLPSGLSLLLSIVFLGVSIIANSYDSLRRALDITYWDVSVKTLLLDWLSSGLARLVGKQAADAIVLGTIWAVVGLVVYVAIRGLARLIADFEHGIEERHYLWPAGVNRNSTLVGFIKRCIVQFGMGFIVLVYVLYAGRLLVSYRLPAWLFPDVTETNWLAKMVLFIVFGLLALHFFAILLRLFLLRKRVFG